MCISFVLASMYARKDVCIYVYIYICVCVRPITCNYTQYVYMYIHTYLHSTKSTCYDLKEVKAEGIKLA